MKLWLLKPRAEHRPWYDKVDGFVVRAINEADARLLASGDHGDEGPGFWMNPLESSCEELVPYGVEEVILRDYMRA